MNEENLPLNEEIVQDDGTLAPEDIPAPEEETAAEEKLSAKEELIKKIPYYKRYYLQYRGGNRSEALDIAGTKAFLQNLGFDGGELRQAREEKNRAEALSEAENGNSEAMCCSYCGSKISGVEFFRLPDGRLRCTSCSNTVVKTKTEMEELCRRVIENMDNFFGATIGVPVSIEVLDEIKLKKKTGIPIGTRDDQSIFVLGVAINKKNTYKILLENGAPRISIIATFAHELTHVWQYINWENQKGLRECPKDKRVLIHEGMAKWVEIQYAYLINEAATAKREEIATTYRDDEYGRGFLRYRANYPFSLGTVITKPTPFMNVSEPLDEQYCGTFRVIPPGGQAPVPEGEEVVPTPEKEIPTEPVKGPIERDAASLNRFAYNLLAEDEK